MKKISSILAVAILVFIAFGCRSCETIDSSKLDPSEIYQEYSVTVSDRTAVSAEFRVSGSTGTTIALVAPSKVEHNGRAMNEHLRTVFAGTYYSAENDGFVGSHTFVFTDNSGKQYRNSIEFEPIKIATDSINLSKGARTIVIPLSRGLVDGESLSAQLVSDLEQPKSTPNSLNSNTDVPAGPDYSNDFAGAVDNNAKSLTIDTERLRNFVVGKAKIHLSLTATRRPANVGLRGGSISYSLRSPAVAANVTN
ncbi:MAG: hypothetical protein IPO41_11120 [Acidobacteria bacterium]|nr:hypothetical protein [Acidobacteriota bacterium]